MKDTTFFIVVGALTVISLASGVLGYLYAEHKEEKENHGDPATFHDLYEDNAPNPYPYPSNRELIEEYMRDCGCSNPSEFL